MESWAKLLESLAIIAWPLLVLLVIFRFTPAVKGLTQLS